MSLFPRESRRVQAVKHLWTCVSCCDCDVKDGKCVHDITVCRLRSKHTLTYVNSSLCTLFSDSLSWAQGQTHTIALMSSLRDRTYGLRCRFLLLFPHALTHKHARIQIHRCHTGMTSPQTWVTAILLCLHTHYEARETHDDWLIGCRWHTPYLFCNQADSGLWGSHRQKARGKHIITQTSRHKLSLFTWEKDKV